MKLYRASWTHTNEYGDHRFTQDIDQAQYDALTASPKVWDLRAYVIGSPACPTLISVLSEQDAHWLTGGAPSAEYLATLGQDN